MGEREEKRRRVEELVEKMVTGFITTLLAARELASTLKEMYSDSEKIEDELVEAILKIIDRAKSELAVSQEVIEGMVTGFCMYAPPTTCQKLREKIIAKEMAEKGQII